MTEYKSLKIQHLTFGILILCSLAQMSCDPTFCRDCQMIEYDIRQWCIGDEENAQQIVFLDSNAQSYIFELEEVDFSQPYRACEIAHSEDEVTCDMSKTLTYSCEELGLDFRVSYVQHIDLVRKDVTPITYGFKKSRVDSFMELLQSIYWSDSTQFGDFLFKNLDSVSMAGQTYRDVLSFQRLELILNIEPDLNEPNPVDPLNLESLIFRPPFGLIQFATMEYGSLIRQL